MIIFVPAAGRAGVGRRAPPPWVNFFAPGSVDANGAFLWNAGSKQPGDFVDLRAEMNIIVVLSNCAHPLNPFRAPVHGPVTLLRHRAPPAGSDDPCRTISPEIVRAFEFTDRLFA